MAVLEVCIRHPRGARAVVQRVYSGNFSSGTDIHGICVVVERVYFFSIKHVSYTS